MSVLENKGRFHIVAEFHRITNFWHKNTYYKKGCVVKKYVKSFDTARAFTNCIPFTKRKNVWAQITCRRITKDGSKNSVVATVSTIKLYRDGVCTEPVQSMVNCKTDKTGKNGDTLKDIGVTPETTPKGGKGGTTKKPKPGKKTTKKPGTKPGSSKTPPTTKEKGKTQGSGGSSGGNHTKYIIGGLLGALVYVGLIYCLVTSCRGEDKGDRDFFDTAYNKMNDSGGYQAPGGGGVQMSEASVRIKM